MAPVSECGLTRTINVKETSRVRKEISLYDAAQTRSKKRQKYGQIHFWAHLLSSQSFFQTWRPSQFQIKFRLPSPRRIQIAPTDGIQRRSHAELHDKQTTPSRSRVAVVNIDHLNRTCASPAWCRSQSFQQPICFSENVESEASEFPATEAGTFTTRLR